MQTRIVTPPPPLTVTNEEMILMIALSYTHRIIQQFEFIQNLKYTSHNVYYDYFKLLVTVTLPSAPPHFGTGPNVLQCSPFFIKREDCVGGGV